MVVGSVAGFTAGLAGAFSDSEQDTAKRNAEDGAVSLFLEADSKHGPNAVYLLNGSI